MCARVNEIYSNTNSVQCTTLCMGTTGTAAFVIGGVTCHSILYLPFNIPFTNFSGISLTKLQERLKLVKVIIINEVCMMEKTYLT